MKYSNCPVCKKEIDHDSPICTHCNKGVFVVDFGDSAARLIAGGFFDKPNAYEICGWHDIVVPPGTTPPKPPREYRCEKYKPVNFLER